MRQASFQHDPHASDKSYTEKATELGEQALDRASDAASAAVGTAKEYPFTTIALIAGVGFAIGALWKVGHSRQQSRVDSLLARLSDLQEQLPRRWRI
jgi:hypothetical protein